MVSKTTKIAIGSVFTATLLIFGATAAVEARAAHSSRIAADNSLQNSRIEQTAAPTAQDQPNDRADRLTAARVRKAVVSDQALSTYGQNIKIIVSAGRITLEGPVQSSTERQLLLSDISSVADSRSIVNRITVSTSAPSQTQH